MSIARVKTWNAGDVLTAFDLNAEFNNILSNPVALWSPAQTNLNFNGKIITWDSGGQSTSTSSATTGFLLSPGAKSGVPGVTFGSQLDIATQTFTDTGTSSSGTAASFAATIIHGPTISSQNSSITTTDAATLYTDPPTAGTNETITNRWAAWFNGAVRLGGIVQFDGATRGTYSPWSTGDGKITLKTVADAGWVMMDDGTMGDASSGATTRANADTVDLFTLLWNNVPTLTVSGGRGATAGADYAAHKTITLPLQLGRAIVTAGLGAGLTLRTLGTSLGVEDTVIPTHSHIITDPGHSHLERADVAADSGSVDVMLTGAGGAPNQAAVSSTASSTTGVTVNNTGVSPVSMNMQPSTFWNVMVKL